MSVEDDYDDYETARLQEHIESEMELDNRAHRVLILAVGAIVAVVALLWLVR